MKIVIKIVLLIGVLSYLIFAVGKLSTDKDLKNCIGIKVLIEDSVSHPYIDVQYIENIIDQTNIPVKNNAISNIDITTIRTVLQNCPYIDSVLCYYTSDNLMCIRVCPRQPVIRIIPNDSVSYYMDQNGNTMPTDEFHLDICLATGNITQEYAKNNLIEIAQYINNTAPWNKDIQQIHVKNEKHIILIPKKGEHTIIIGEPTDIADKMERLTIFYRDVLNQIGWNKYHTIDLNYSNQVVCKKRNKK